MGKIHKEKISEYTETTENEEKQSEKGAEGDWEAVDKVEAIFSDDESENGVTLLEKTSAPKKILKMEKYVDEQKFIIKFIENYRNLPALWNIKLEAYNNRDERKKQYEILLEIFKEQYPNGTIDDVKKKINVLRTSFRREKQRLAECCKSGAGAEDSLGSHLFYYAEMEFLDDMEKPCTSKSTTSRLKETKAAKRKSDPADVLIDLAKKKFCSNERNKTTAITDSWAVKMERMTTEQRLLCEKFVDEVMFEGQMGTLHRNFVQINPSNDFQPISRGSSSTPAQAYTSNSSISNPPLLSFFSSFSHNS